MKGTDTLEQRVDALLPQIQCRRCGYAGCRPYARALVEGTTEVNRCPPGGARTIVALAALLGAPARPLDPVCGEHRPQRVAVIDEPWCIGCTLCIQACPVDAILGAATHMHVVLESECTGCELCVAPCPVDCIAMAPVANGPCNDADWMAERAPHARRRFEQRAQRLLRGGAAQTESDAGLSGSGGSVSREPNQMRAEIAAAVARVHARRTRRSRSLYGIASPPTGSNAVQDPGSSSHRTSES